MSTWPVVKQVGGPSDLISAQTPCSVYGGCTPEHKAYCKPYLGYLSLLPTILQVPEVKESVIRAAGGGGRAGFGRGPSSIPTQLPCVQQFEVPPF